ncbi:hypothetical protein BX666DRAFT_1932643 [Dichotomocladium elegans]|nr:hypothetical protein BX666DRAFT_1932643 [Dichotomocladium elegans]
MEKAKDSFERKLNALMTQAEHLTERKIRVIKCEKVDWEILYEDARTRREHYLQRIQVLRAAANEVADNVVSTM